MRSIFLQDGNNLIVKPKEIICILKHLKQAFPEVKRITSYARSSTIVKMSDDNLKCMADEGLNRIHIGMEPGSDKVLEMVREGTDKATQINAGKKVKAAGLELYECYMPGLGGQSLSRENALETADALNQINPDFIRLRTLEMPESAPLTEQFKTGEFDKMGDTDTAAKLLLFLGSQDGITSTIKSDHVLNLFPEVDGVFSEDKDKVIQPVRDFLKLDREEQMTFCIGRRTHRISRFSNLNDSLQRKNALKMCRELWVTVENMDEVVDSLMEKFI